MAKQERIVTPQWVLLSRNGATAVLHVDDKTTLSISANGNILDLTVFGRGGITEKATLTADPETGQFKTLITDAKGRRSMLDGAVADGCATLDYTCDGDLVFALEEPTATIPASFAAAQADPKTQPDVPVIGSFLQTVNDNPYIREQVLRLVGDGVGPVTPVPLAIDFCDFACSVCWGSGGTAVHACIACIYCNSFAIETPTAP